LSHVGFDAQFIAVALASILWVDGNKLVSHKKVCVVLF